MSEHTHDFPAGFWSFPDPPNTTAITTVHVLEGLKPVLLVTHDADDGTWQMICGTTNDPPDGRVVCLGCMVSKDATLVEVADLPLGWVAWRDEVGGPWGREPRGD
jgi:hypothetical protein